MYRVSIYCAAGVCLLGLLSAWEPLWSQCVMCRTQIESNLAVDEGKHAAEGINVGILYLIAIPYIGLACLASCGIDELSDQIRAKGHR